MNLKDWLRAKVVPDDATAETYANALIAEGITDNEQDLPNVGLTWEDLKDIRAIKVGYRNRILKAIREIGQPVLVRKPNEAAEARHDLIKRFLPVALSVGFAARLVDINWVKNGTPITYDQLEQLARLFTGVFVAVSGWEWYHRDLKWHPLNNAGRFFVDVAVVITTIVFLYSAKDEAHWFGSLIFIFFLYLIWDGLTIWEYKEDFHPSTGPLGFQPLRGPITDFLWFIYFVAIAYLTLWPFSTYNYQTFVACLFVFLGALSLRLLASEPEGMSGGQLAWAAFVRGLVVIGLIAVYFIVSIFHVADYIVAKLT
jgi:hypothetical protein